jgi:(R,R)-butanediol dehydrogenase/meso-butanediol dehydrogenase/diacetyl reductase
MAGRAALITGRETVDFLDLPDPDPHPGGVVVQIAFCGICGTDVHAWQSGEPYTPAVCGHEWSGTVSAVGEEVRGVSEGDRVVVAVPPACGRCSACAAGQAEHCQTVFLHAVGRAPGAPAHGGFATAIAIDAARVVPAHPALSDADAAQVEPATVTFHAVRRCPPRLGDLAVVQGAGPIGLLTLQWVRSAGAGHVVVVEPNPVRAALAASLGAASVVSPADAAAMIREQTRGLGADVVYECVGRPETVQSAVDLVRRGGQMALIGLANGTVSIDPRVWLVKEVRAVAALAYLHEEFEAAQAMIADGRVNVSALHDQTVDLDGLPAALADLASGTSVHTKVLVQPRG